MKTKNPLLIVDVSCLIWRILEHYPTVLSLRPEFADKWLRAQWTLYLQRPTDLLPVDIVHDTIVVFDTKKRGQYWRHLLAPQYKGGRGEKSVEYWQCKRTLLRMLKEPQWAHLKVFGCPIFEADDFVAEVCRLVGDRREAYIVSIDGDLLQLVQKNIKFAWCYNGHERLKDETLALSYIERKLGICLKSLKEFGKIKSVIGDASDNLPEGGDVRVFDLTERDKEFSLKKMYKNWKEMKEYLEKPNYVDNTKLYRNALLWTQKAGLPIVHTQ